MRVSSGGEVRLEARVGWGETSRIMRARLMGLATAHHRERHDSVREEVFWTEAQAACLRATGKENGALERKHGYYAAL